MKLVRIMGAADCRARTPLDDRYVVAWDWNTEFGTLCVTSTDDVSKARRFAPGEEFREWRSVSKVQPRRPSDGAPNRPLTALTIISEDEPS